MTHNTSVFYGSGQDFNQFALTYIVKELLQVHINHVDISVICVLLALFQGIVCPSVRAEAKTVLRELFLEDGT